MRIPAWILYVRLNCRRYDITVSFIRQQLAGDSSVVIVQLLSLFYEAKKSMTVLISQMDDMMG